ncbi:MAG: DUF169 domain-containing protein [Candidatus Glassbacteria bacterium]
METAFRNEFSRRWQHYFPGAELPVAFYYADSPGDALRMEEPAGWRCFIGELGRVRRGESLAFDQAAVSCTGGRRYLGFTKKLRPNFEYFLSCGIEDEMEGERYKKGPELVRQMMYNFQDAPASGKYIIFKRWDNLGEDDDPEAVIFFAHPDVLSGLFTLANFDRPDLDGVYAPFSAGCGSVVQYARLEGLRPEPRAVLGMFDVSARPHVAGNLLSFSVPMNRFREMAANMDESFLITESWKKVRTRIERELKTS